MLCRGFFICLKSGASLGQIFKLKIPLSYLRGILERCLAESNRSSRFCRPVPNRSAKAPFPYWDCKYSNFCRNCKILFNFFCITFREHGDHSFQLNRSVLHNDLFHVKQQSLEVLSFRMVDIDRVVTWLVETVQNTDASAALSCC